MRPSLVCMRSVHYSARHRSIRIRSRANVTYVILGLLVSSTRNKEVHTVPTSKTSGTNQRSISSVVLGFLVGSALDKKAHTVSMAKPSGTN